jgi:prophage DNA circulation protein
VPLSRSAGVQTATVATLVSSGIAARATVQAAAAQVQTVAASGQPAALATAVQALSANVLGAISSPASAIRLVATLASFSPTGYTTSSVIGQGVATARAAVATLCRRAAVVTVARASSSYAPASSDDAVTVRTTVTALLDAEISAAGDSGDDQTFKALRALRQAVVADLNTRGAALPALKTFQLQASLPAAVLSLRLYRDASRADQIAGETGAPHPAFEPTTIRVLAR